MLQIQQLFRLGLLLPITAAALSCGAPEQVPRPAASEQDVEAVRAAVEAHWKAINEADSAVNPHTADVTLFMPQFEGQFGEGSDEMRQLVARGKPATPIVLRDVQVQMLGSDAAVVTFYQDGSFWAEGDRDDRRPRRVTEVWIREEDAWKEAHHHDSVFAPLP